MMKVSDAFNSYFGKLFLCSETGSGPGPAHSSGFSEKSETIIAVSKKPIQNVENTCRIRHPGISQKTNIRRGGYADDSENGWQGCHR
jgi:hypothetical protein